MRTHQIRHRQRIPAVLVGAGLAAFLLIGCSATDGTLRPTTTIPASAGPTGADQTPELTILPTDPAATAIPTPPGQTDTAWGRIWDGIPTGFPTYPGARPTESRAGPASSTLDVGTADPRAVMDFYQKALQGAGWIIVSVSEPREDGSRELTSVNIHPSCQLQITATPLGASTIVTILFGAGCPFS